MPLRGLFLSLIVLTSFLPRAQANEGEKKRILLMSVERGESVLSVVPREVAESLRTILRNNRTLKVLLPGDLKKTTAVVVETPKAKVKDKILQKADKALWAAKEIHSKERYLKAAKMFKKAKVFYEKRLGKLRDFDKYIDAALGISLSYFSAGYDDNGEDALAPVMIMKPTTVLDRRKVPKAAIEALDRLRKLYARTSSARIKITSQPTGAVVYVDGVLRGQTPTMVSGLWRGRHVVRLVKEGHDSAAKWFTASGREQTVTVRLKPVRVKRTKLARAKRRIGTGPDISPILAAAKSGRYGKAFKKVAQNLCKEFDLNAIVMPYVRRAGRRYDLAAFFYQPKIKRVAELEWVSFAGDLADMQAKLLRVEEQILQGLALFPRSRVLARKAKSKIYDAFVPPTPPAPKVVAKPNPPVGPPKAPAPVAVKSRPPPPAPKPTPVATLPPVAPAPTLRVKRASPARLKPVPSVSPAPGAPAPVVRAPVYKPPAPPPRPARPAVVRRPSRASEILRPVPPPPNARRPTYAVGPVRPAPRSPTGFRPTPAPVYGPASAPVYAPARIYRQPPRPVYAPAPVYARAPVYAPVAAPRPAPVYSPSPTAAPVYRPSPTAAPVYAPRPMAPSPVYSPKPIVTSRPTNPAPLFSPGPVGLPAPPGVTEAPWYKKWWVWTIIGGAVVAGTGAAVGLALSGDEPLGFRTTVNWGTE